MDNEALDATLQVVGVLSIASLFLPAIESTWDAKPGDDETRKRLRTGETVYLVVVTAAAGLAAVRSRSVFPLVFAAVLAGVVVATFERAMTSRPPQVVDSGE